MLRFLQHKEMKYILFFKNKTIKIQKQNIHLFVYMAHHTYIFHINILNILCVLRLPSRKPYQDFYPCRPRTFPLTYSHQIKFYCIRRMGEKVIANISAFPFFICIYVYFFQPLLFTVPRATCKKKAICCNFIAFPGLNGPAQKENIQTSRKHPGHEYRNTYAVTYSWNKICESENSSVIQWLTFHLLIRSN